MPYLLHIGRHKTGTSSLQRFLFRNRKQLERRGFYYPKSGMEALAHHHIARHCMGSGLDAAAGAGAAQSVEIRALIEEISGRKDVALLSSEGFQNCAPRAVEQVFGAGQTDVVVYIREQVAYLVSAYQQRVHASMYHGSLEDYAKDFVVDYDAFLRDWEQVFGREHVFARLYGPALLKDGDIISDFCATAGIPLGPNIIRPASDRNPSIGGALLEFKRLINASLAQHKTDRTIYRALSDFAAGSAGWRERPLLAPEIVAAVRGAARDSNERVFDRYDGMSEGFGPLSDASPSRPGRPIEKDEIILIAEQFAARNPAESEALLAAARSHAGRTGVSTWAGLIATVKLTPNFYAQRAEAVVGGKPASMGKKKDAASPPASPPPVVVVHRWTDAVGAGEHGAEANQEFIRSLYQGILHRGPSDGELAHWLKALDDDLDPLQLPARLTASKEFQRLEKRPNGSAEANTAYIEQLCHGLLHRAPKESELTRWLAELESGLDPRRLVARLSASKEFRKARQRETEGADDNPAFIQTLFHCVLERAPKDNELEHWLSKMDKGLDPRQLLEKLTLSDEFRRIGSRRKSLFVPPGHAFSPIVDVDQVRERYGEAPPDAAPAALRVDDASMRRNWNDLLPFLQDIPFPEQADAAWRYHFGHPAFGRGDGSILHAMLRRHRPRRVVEVGSGVSTTCIVDTIDHFLDGAVELSFVEARAGRLGKLLGEETARRFTVHPHAVQDTDLRVFAALEAGDFLFINSTHVLKTGSDVAHILFEVLPALKPGVFVHIHGIFWPFEYSPKWIVEDNRSWNEIYGLRAFLMYNEAFEVVAFNDYWARKCPDLIGQDYPAMLWHSGASLWLRKTSAGTVW